MNQDKVLKEKSVKVVQSNELTEAAYTLTLNEQRLILLAASKIKKGQVVTGATPFSITAQEFSTVFGVENAYPELKAAEGRLYDRSVYFYQKGHYGDKTKPYTKAKWVQAVDYIPNEGEIVIYFSERIIPFLCMLNDGRFTISYMDVLSELSSTYSIRLYMMLSQWRTVGSLYISIEDFKKRLELNSVSYELISKIKTKVIDVAVNELNEKSNMSISYDFEKKGRARVGINFTFQEEKLKSPKKENGALVDKKPVSSSVISDWERLHDLELKTCRSLNPEIATITKANIENIANTIEISTLEVMQKIKIKDSEILAML